MSRVMFADSMRKNQTEKTTTEPLKNVGSNRPSSEVGRSRNSARRSKTKEQSLPPIVTAVPVDQTQTKAADQSPESASRSRRDIAETYREGQKLSYDTVGYYEKMNEMLAGEAKKAQDENRDLTLRISELETKLVLVAGLIKEKELKKDKELQVSHKLLTENVELS